MRLIFGFLSKYPALGIALCLGLLIGVSGPKMLSEGKMNGYFGGADLIKADVIEKFTEQYTYRGRESTACMVLAQINDQKGKVRVECSEWESLTPGGKVDLVKDDGEIQSISFMKGHFGFDLALVIVEVVGAIYFTNLLRRGGEIKTVGQAGTPPRTGV